MSLFRDLVEKLNQCGEEVEIRRWDNSSPWPRANAQTKYNPERKDCDLSLFIGDEYIGDEHSKVAINFQLLESGPISGLRFEVLHQLYSPSRESFSLSHWENSQLWVVSFDAGKVAEEIHGALESYRKALLKIREIEKSRTEEVRSYHTRIKEAKEAIGKTINNLAQEIVDAVQTE